VIKPGSKVLIQGADSWSIGTVEQLANPEELPEIAGAPPAGIVQGYLAEMKIERIAMISHDGKVFAALFAGGWWWDLQHQRLNITELMVTGPS